MTITIRLPEQLENQLRARLDTDGTPLSEYVRQAIAEKLKREPGTGNPSTYELGKHLFGKYASGRSDVSENADEIVAEIIREKHTRRNDSR